MPSTNRLLEQILEATENGGGGSSEKHGGANYNDTSTSQSPINVIADTWMDVPNDGLGPVTNLTYFPEGVTSLMDTPSGKFDFSQLGVGDQVWIRNDYTVFPNTNNALLELRYQLGANFTAYTLESKISRLDSGSGAPYRFSLKPDYIFMGDSNTIDNLVTLQIRLSSNGLFYNSGSAIGVVRK